MNQKIMSPESLLTLLAGVLCLYMSRAFAWPVTALLAPIFMIRFLRTRGLISGSLILGLAASIAMILPFGGLKGSMFNSDAAYYVVITVSTIAGLIPMTIDRYFAYRIPSWSMTLIYPSLKVFMEFAGSLNSPFGAWGSSSALFAGWLPLSQIVSVTGIWGLSFLLCWFASFLNFAWDRNFNLKGIRRGLIIFSTYMLMILLFGVIRICGEAPAPKVKVAAVLAADSLQTPAKNLFYAQIHDFGNGNMSSDSIVSLREKFAKNNDFLLRQTQTAAARGAKIIFWAEGNGMVFKQDEQALLVQGASVAKNDSIYLGMAIEVYSGGDKRPVENKIVFFNPDGSLAWQYYKRYPIGLENETMVTGDGEIKTLQTPYGKLAAVICFDTDYIRFARKVGKSGADILFAPSNDWKEIAEFRGKLTKFRSLENGLTLIRPTSHGVTEMIDSRGRVILMNDFYQNPQTLLMASVPVKSEGSFYAKTGDWFAILSIMIFLSILVGYGCKKKSGKLKSIVSTMIVVLLFSSFALQAQTKGSSDSSFKNKSILFPAISYAPETSMALGASLIRIFRSDSSAASQISATALYTFKNQYLAESNAQLFFNQNRWLAKGKFNFNKYPENYFGIGNHTEEQDKNMVTYHVMKIEGAVMKNVLGNLYIGPRVYFSDYYAVSGEKDLSGEMGSSGGITVGAGAGMVYDSRDDLSAPEKGFYADVSFIHHDKFLGSRYAYTSTEADLRKYISFGSSTVFAVQGLAQIKSGDIPFFQLAYLGGSNMMRGLYAGRFRDKNLLALQAELRQKLSQKWGVAIFGGLGEVMPSFSRFSVDDLHESFGLGFRRRLSKTGRVNLRMDAGVANGKINFYVNISEAF